MSFQIGDRIGDYQVIDVLGAGGMGKVYKVKNVISERIEALKILLPNLASDPELADRFMREIKVQASLEHPNIAGLRTAQQIDNQLVMIVEFVDGVSLEQLMRQGSVPLANAIEIVSQVLGALAHAHKSGIVHRDIKPANIMVTHAGVAKLMDFGIAKAAAERRLTQTGRTVGSLYYMSPEQIQGSADLDGRADVYSLGVTLYELVTGQRPFRGDSDYSIMAAHLSQTPVPPMQLDPKVPPALSEVILQSIAKDPAQRFQTADAFRAALGSVGRSVAPAAGTIPLPAAPQRPPHADANVTPGSSKRALYMVAGSIVTIAVLALAAIQVPKYFQASAGDSPEPQVAQGQPAAAPTETAQPAPTPPVEQAAPALPRVDTPAVTAPPVVRPPTASPTPVERKTPAPKEPVQIAQAANPKTIPENQPAISAPPQAVPTASNQAAVPNRAAVPNPELANLSSRFDLLATRVNTARSGLKRLSESQARLGLGLRGDMTTASSRMEMFMDQAESALKSSDGAGSKKSMDSAERELEKIEKLLEGR